MEMTRFEKYFVNREYRGRHNAARVQRIVAQLDAGRIRDVLEIGCGMGTASALLADEFGWNVVGTDYDPLQIEEARARYPESGGLRFQREDATRLSFPERSFDFAFTQYVFHHIPAWRDAVRELARVVRPDGAVYWRDFAAPAVMRGALSLIGMSDACVRDDNRAAFLAAGFQLLLERRGPFVDEVVYWRAGG